MTSARLSAPRTALPQPKDPDAMNQVDVQTLHRLIAEGAKPRVIDVREAYEYAAGHVGPAESVPMSTLPSTYTSLPRDEDLYVICQSGNRSLTVTAWLAQRGYRVVNVQGGTFAWQLAGFPITA